MGSSQPVSSLARGPEAQGSHWGVSQKVGRLCLWWKCRVGMYSVNPSSLPSLVVKKVATCL